MQAPVTSTIASTAPTSWNWTWSTEVPCTRASASASLEKMRAASIQLSSLSPEKRVLLALKVKKMKEAKVSRD